jgi:hypothetical protein
MIFNLKSLLRKKTSITKKKETSEEERVSKDDETIRTSNLPAPATAEELPSEDVRSGPLTFNPRPLEEEDEHTKLAASDDQAELMQWHYCLGHLPFSRLKQLAIIGKNSQETRQGCATQVHRLSL